jgi:hypothetical protein
MHGPDVWRQLALAIWDATPDEDNSGTGEEHRAVERSPESATHKNDKPLDTSRPQDPR